jgi:hypothetical protein
MLKSPDLKFHAKRYPSVFVVIVAIFVILALLEILSAGSGKRSQPLSNTILGAWHVTGGIVDGEPIDPGNMYMDNPDVGFIADKNSDQGGSLSLV